VKLLRRRVDPRVEEATAAHAAGDFVRARELAADIVADGNPSLEALRGLAELEYLLGDYEGAEPLLRRVVEDAGRNVELRVDAEVALALVYLQTNRFAAARSLFAGLGDAVDLPLWKLMKSFGEEQPYWIEWGGETELALSFTQTTTWELPCVRIEVNGLEVTRGSTRAASSLPCLPTSPRPSGSSPSSARRGSSPPARAARSATDGSTRFGWGR
jgi:hypothetical protein